MEISKELATNILKDFQKKNISHEEKSKFISDLLKDKNISIRELARQTNIPFSTLYDQYKMLTFNREKKKQDIKILQYNNKNIDTLIERVTFLLTRDFIKTEKTIKRLEDLREEINKTLLNLK